jgi:hypothetical protein
MKMILLLYLEDDAEAVRELLEDHSVLAYSELPLEGRGGAGSAPGSFSGWYGEVAPYRSRMAFTLVSDGQADALMEAVRRCRACTDRRHPVHGVQLHVEAATRAGEGADADSTRGA